LGSLDHKCTLVHLALGGRVCLGYIGGRSPSRESGTRGGEVPDVRSKHRPPNPFYTSCGLPRHKRQPRGCVSRSWSWTKTLGRDGDDLTKYKLCPRTPTTTICLRSVSIHDRASLFRGVTNPSGPGLCGVLGEGDFRGSGPGICRILDMNFAEYLFHDVRE
jgi:hypothetical protein